MKNHFFMFSLLKSIFEFFELVFSKNSCVICGKSHNFFCTACQKEIFITASKKYYCCRCGREMSDDFGICIDCLNKPVFFALQSCKHLISYRKKQKKFILEWKFHGKRNLVFAAAIQLYKKYSQVYAPLAVVPVPPRKERIETSGYDCVNDIAFIFRFCFNVRVLKPLIRIDSEEQKHKKFALRIKKTQNRYALKNGFKIKDSAVVLIDDIMTTGTTLEECAGLLKKAGANEVFAITLFYA